MPAPTCRPLLLALPVLAAAVTSCAPDCAPPTESFEIEAELTSDQLWQAEVGFDGEISEENCAWACDAAYFAEKGWDAATVASCTLTVDLASYKPEEDPEGIAGQVTCAGEGQSYGCD